MAGDLNYSVGYSGDSSTLKNGLVVYEPYGTRIGYENVLEDSDSGYTITSTGDSSTALDLTYLYDNISTTRYSAVNVGDLTISISTDSDFSGYVVDYVGIAGLNWSSASVNSVEIEVISTYYDSDLDEYLEETETVFTMDTSSFEDNKILMANFKGRYAKTVNVYLYSDSTDTDISLSILSAGKSFELPSLPDNSFQPGFLNIEDEKKSLRTSTNKFGSVNITQKGFTEKYTFSKVTQDFMNDYWSEFIREVKTDVLKPAFVQNNPMDYPEDAVFGRLKISDASYTSRTRSTISFSVVGAIGER